MVCGVGGCVWWGSVCGVGVYVCVRKESGWEEGVGVGGRREEGAKNAPISNTLPHPTYSPPYTLHITLPPTCA